MRSASRAPPARRFGGEVDRLGLEVGERGEAARGASAREAGGCAVDVGHDAVEGPPPGRAAGGVTEDDARKAAGLGERGVDEAQAIGRGRAGEGDPVGAGVAQGVDERREAVGEVGAAEGAAREGGAEDRVEGAAGPDDAGRAGDEGGAEAGDGEGGDGGGAGDVIAHPVVEVRRPGAHGLGKAGPVPEDHAQGALGEDRALHVEHADSALACEVDDERALRRVEHAEGVGVDLDVGVPAGERAHDLAEACVVRVGDEQDHPLGDEVEGDRQLAEPGGSTKTCLIVRSGCG